MKRISFFLATAILAAPALCPAQDAATEERLNKLSAQMDVLIEAKDAQNKKIEDLQNQIRDLQNQVSKPTGNYASPEDVKKLADAITDVDKKRAEDNKNVTETLENLKKALLKGGGSTRVAPTPPVNPTPTSNGPEKGYDYIVQQGDTLGLIAKAYREKNIKVSVAQILAANPGLKPENMKVGQKIFIPAPAQ
jgi:LysM repeat protein